MTFEQTRSILLRELAAIEGVIPTVQWFVFGSFSRNDPNFEDIDLYAVAANLGQAIQVRKKVTERLGGVLPVHLTVCTQEEEKELNFIENQTCIPLDCVFIEHRIVEV